MFTMQVYCLVHQKEMIMLEEENVALFYRAKAVSIGFLP